jgi:hypothetical protein
MVRRLPFLLVALPLAAAAAATAHAQSSGINPDISVIGQPFARWSDAADDPARKRATLDPGETEIFFDAALNPYARGTFTIAFAEEGAEVEEGFFVLNRLLPANLALKAGKYRLGFGKLNPVHPHADPFPQRFRVLGYLPGEESFNETAVQVSALLPLGADASLTASVDGMRGRGFLIERESSGASNDPLETGDGDRAEEPRAAVLGRLSGFVPFGERSGVELGVSATQGTNNVAAGTRTTALGADLKVKWWNSPSSYLVLQGEVLRLDREAAAWDSSTAAYASEDVDPVGFYAFADYNWNRRYNLGASVERSQQPTADKTWDSAFGVFAGLALMEETTAFRIGWERFQPGTPEGASEDPEAIHTFTLRVVFSMGPHKAHAF